MEVHNEGCMCCDCVNAFFDSLNNTSICKEDVGELEGINQKLSKLAEFEPKEHISASQLKSFPLCPTRWFDGIAHNDIQQPCIPAIFGDAGHLAIEKMTAYACEKFDGYTEHLTEKMVVDTWMETISGYPVLLSKDHIARGLKQLQYWLSEEKRRKPHVIGYELSRFCYLPSGILVKAIIDRIETNNRNPVGVVEVIDWKTGFLKDDYSIAMTLYKILTANMLKNSKTVQCDDIVTTIYQLEGEYFEHYDIDDSDEKKLVSFATCVRDSMMRFTANVKAVLAKRDLSELHEFLQSQTRFNKYCYTCRLASSCKTYIQEVYGFLPGLGDDQTENIKMLLEQQEHLKMVVKSAERGLDRIDATIKTILSSNNGDAIEVGDGRKIEYQSRKYRHFDPRIVLPILIKNGMISVLDVQFGKLDSVIPLLPQEDQEKIRESMYTTKGNESWKVLKQKK